MPASLAKKHKQLRRIVPEMGGGSNCLCVSLFPGEKGTHKHNSLEISGEGWESPGIIPGQSRETFVYAFSCLLVFAKLTSCKLLYLRARRSLSHKVVVKLKLVQVKLCEASSS